MDGFGNYNLTEWIVGIKSLPFIPIRGISNPANSSFEQKAKIEP